MRRITVVIPTHWCWPRGNIGLPEDSIFDHPTPIDGVGTLSRCLESLNGLSTHNFQVLLIAAPVNPKLDGEVEKRVEELIEPFRVYFPIGQFAPSDLKRVRTTMGREGLDPGLVSLDSYAQIRNCQILASVLLDSDLIVAIDDDETVPPDYLDRAGPAGIYLDAAGEYHLKASVEEKLSENKFVRKAVLINEQFDACFASKQRVMETPVALGGNMVFPPGLFRNVSFDPGITRVEDIDYLMNSRLFGYPWVLDKELKITHLPPKASAGDPVTTTAYAKLQPDVLRFINQRQKIRISQEYPDLNPLRAEDFGSHPGEFLKDDLEAQDREALIALRPKDAEERFFPRSETLLELARKRAARANEYPAFNTSLKKNLDVVDGDKALKEGLRRKVSS